MYKRLTRKKAIELCIELWTWCAKTGRPKEEWPEWEKWEAIYGSIRNKCWFCAYDRYQSDRYQSYHDDRICTYCPLDRAIQTELCGQPYYPKYRKAKTRKTRKKYASLFLEMIKTAVE